MECPLHGPRIIQFVKITEITPIMPKKVPESTNNEQKNALEQYVIRIEEEILDAEKVAEVLNSSKKVIERELREGKMIGYKRLSKWFILKSDLVKYIREADPE